MGIEFKEGDYVEIKEYCSGVGAKEICMLRKDGDGDLYAQGAKEHARCLCKENWVPAMLSRETKQKFKVGDKVVAISATTYGWGNIKYGDIGIIVSDWGNFYYIDFPNQSRWSAKASDIILYKDFTPTQSQPDPTLVFKGDGVYQWGPTMVTPFWEQFLGLESDGLLNKLSKLTSNRKETTMQKLTKALKRLFSADQAKMYEARLIKQDGSLTEAGMAAVIDFVSEQEDCKKFLLKEAQAILDEEKDEDED